MAVAILREPDGRTNHIELARVRADPVPETGGARLALTGPAFDLVVHLDPAESADLARALQAASQAIRGTSSITERSSIVARLKSEAARR